MTLKELEEIMNMALDAWRKNIGEGVELRNVRLADEVIDLRDALEEMIVDYGDVGHVSLEHILRVGLRDYRKNNAGAKTRGEANRKGENGRGAQAWQNDLDRKREANKEVAARKMNLEPPDEHGSYGCELCLKKFTYGEWGYSINDTSIYCDSCVGEAIARGY